MEFQSKFKLFKILKRLDNFKRRFRCFGSCYEILWNLVYKGLGPVYMEIGIETVINWLWIYLRND